MLAFDDGAIARLLIAATRLPAEVDRVRLLENFAAAAERPGADQLRKIPQSPRRPRARSPAAVNQARYRDRDRRGIRVFRFPLDADDLAFFARLNWVTEDRLGDHDAVVGGVLARLRELYRNKKKALLVTP
jgi:hypothetical protein